MMSALPVSGGKARRRLSPSEKYEMWMSIVTGQATQREAAERYGVDRSTVVTACRVAKQGALDALAASVPGRPGQSGQDAALAAATAEIERLRATVAEQAVVLHLHAGKRVGTDRRPVPPRVDEPVKAGLLDLVEQAVERGWSARRAAGLLGLDHVRLGRWAARRQTGQLADRAPGGHPLHGLLEHERAAIVALFETWGEIDRSHRKLAHRGSRLGLVHVSESTVRRVLTTEDLVLPGQPVREPVRRTPWPDWLEWKPNRVWAYDFTHFGAARRAALAILDVVSRRWLTTLVSPRRARSRSRSPSPPRWPPRTCSTPPTPVPPRRCAPRCWPATATGLSS